MTIHQKFTGDASQLLQCYQQQSKEIVHLEQQFGKLAQKMNEGTRAGKGGFDLMSQATKSAGSEIGGLVTSWLSVSAAIAAVNQEIEHNRRLAEEALNKNYELAGAQGDFYLNQYGKTPEEIESNKQGIKQLVNELKVPENVVTGAFNSVASTGIGTSEQQMQAIRMAGKVSGQRPENIGNLAKSLLMTQHMAGVNAEEALALNLSAGANAFMENPDSQARAIRQATAAAVASSPGDKRKATEQSAELLAASTQWVGEERGESARTFTAQLSGQLNEFFTKGSEKTGPRGIKIKTKPPVDPGTAGDRIEYLQNNPKLAKAFIENKMSVETMFKAPAERLLLDKNSPEAKTFKKVQADVGYDTKPLPELYKNLESGTAQIQLERSKRTADVNLEQMQLATDLDNRRTRAREILQSSLDATSWRGTDAPIGGKLLKNKITGLAAEAKEQTEPDSIFPNAIKALEEQQRNIRSQPTFLSLLTDGIIPAKQRELSKLGQEDRKQYDFLGEQIAELNRLMQQQIQAQKDLTAAQRDLANPQLNRAPTSVPNAARAERGGHREQ